MTNLFTTKPSARKSDTVSGHTSKQYNSTDKHLLLITCKVTSYFVKDCIGNAIKGAFWPTPENTLKVWILL